VAPVEGWLARTASKLRHASLSATLAPEASQYVGSGCPQPRRSGIATHARRSLVGGPQSEPWYGPSPRSYPRSGMRAMLFVTGRSVGIMGLGGLDEDAAREGGRSFQVLYLGWSECQREAGPLGSPGPWTYQIPSVTY
jgi:hypothetical protein